MIFFRRTIATIAAVSLTGMGFVQTAQAALISTEQVAAAQSVQTVQTGGDARGALNATLARADVVAALQAHGVDAASARERIAALTDAEAQALAAHVDSAPAGGDVLGTIVFIFVLLLVTDILGFTKVYPFTKSIR